ncbi:MAG: response regulator, partial [Gammaproteobacteria bacterium]
MNKVLLVEDDPALRLVLKNLLELKGYPVAEADSVVTVEAVLKREVDIAVIVLDLGLPPSPHS